MKIFNLIFILTFLIFFHHTIHADNEREDHSDEITILDTEEVEKIINSRSAILLDTWKKDIKPEKLDSKKWMPAQRYSLPGTKWLPNVGLETLTPELRKYFEETIYGKFDESLWQQSLRIDLQLVKTWGEIEAGLHASNYLHDFSKNRITFDTELSVRIIRGLSVKFDFRAENIHDQIYLPKSEASLEDVLMNRVKLPSTFDLYTGVGIRVQFGSIYNNIINNRL